MEHLKSILRRFSAERDWDQYHSPKNLASALVVEAGELLEHFQWLTEAQSRQLSQEQCDRVSLEMGDVLIYLVMLADKLGIDLIDAATRKVAINADKYPVAKAKGTATKSTDLR